MKEKFKNIVFILLALYAFIDISMKVAVSYGWTTLDNTCRNKSQEKYYSKYGSLVGYAKRASQVKYVEEHGTLEGFRFYPN